MTSENSIAGYYPNIRMERLSKMTKISMRVADSLAWIQIGYDYYKSTSVTVTS